MSCVEIRANVGGPSRIGRDDPLGASLKMAENLTGCAAGREVLGMLGGTR